jgi:glycosyltransferase involved in cell wall biosynthesis
MARMKSLVSILIPAFNAQDWISDTLRSAIAQTWERKEIIVVDDGSTDQTLAVARQFESDFLRVVTQKNQGAAAARNAAFSLSRGDYIQWLDADDLLSPNKITSQINYALSHGAGRRALLSCAWGHFIHSLQRAQFVPTPLWCDLSPLEWLLRKMEHNVFMQTATWLVSRELTEAAGPWSTELLVDDDGEYFCRVLLASTGTWFVPSARVYYRRSGSSSLSYVGRSDRKMEALFLSLQLHIGYLRSLEDNARVRAACAKLLQYSLVFFYPERPDIVDRAKQLAVELGGRLTVPALSWKYAWIQKAFGWPLARRAQILMPRYKWSFIRSVDRALSLIDKQHPQHE